MKNNNNDGSYNNNINNDNDDSEDLGYKNLYNIWCIKKYWYNGQK